MTIGQRIRQLRTEQGMSQFTLADKLDVDMGNIRKWECGRFKPRKKNVDKLCEIFGVSRAEFMEGVDGV